MYADTIRMTADGRKRNHASAAGAYNERFVREIRSKCAQADALTDLNMSRSLALDGRDAALAKQEAEATKRDEDITKREQDAANIMLTLTNRERDVAKREEDVKKYEETTNKYIDNNLVATAARERRVNKQAEDVSKREQDVTKREQDVTKREQGATKREDARLLLFHGSVVADADAAKAALLEAEVAKNAAEADRDAANKKLDAVIAARDAIEKKLKTENADVNAKLYNALKMNVEILQARKTECEQMEKTKEQSAAQDQQMRELCATLNNAVRERDELQAKVQAASNVETIAREVAVLLVQNTQAHAAAAAAQVVAQSAGAIASTAASMVAAQVNMSIAKSATEITDKVTANNAKTLSDVEARNARTLDEVRAHEATASANTAATYSNMAQLSGFADMPPGFALPTLSALLPPGPSTTTTSSAVPPADSASIMADAFNLPSSPHAPSITAAS
jgi:hypothetical protein